MDGDIQVRRSLAELLTTPLPEGTVEVVPDWVALHSVDGMPHVAANRAYMAGLRFAPEHWGSYFNSGVMMASPDTWNDIGPKALAFLVAGRARAGCTTRARSTTSVAAAPRTCRCAGIFCGISCRSRPTPPSIRPSCISSASSSPGTASMHRGDAPSSSPMCEMAKALRGTDVAWRRQPALQRIAYHFKPLVKRDDYRRPRLSRRGGPVGSANTAVKCRGRTTRVAAKQDKNCRK